MKKVLCNKARISFIYFFVLFPHLNCAIRQKLFIEKDNRSKNKGSGINFVFVGKLFENFFILRKIIAVKTKDMSEILYLWAKCLRTFFSEILLTVWQI